MIGCDTSTDFMFPLTMDIYYPIVTQEAYGNIKRQWVFDRTVSCALFNPFRKTKEDVVPDPSIVIDNSIAGRTRSDLTRSSRGNLNSLNNILITNVRGKDGEIVYNESSGPRAGQATIFEIATFNPSVGPFGSTDYYKILLRRSDNQVADT
jgi:hypothetical protein